MTTEEEHPNILMGPSEVAKYLGVGERTIYLWAQQGKLPAFKTGSVWRFRRSDLDRWLESTRTGPVVDDVKPLAPPIEPKRSKWRIRKDQEEADEALSNACKAYIETTLQSVGREVFIIQQFEERFGEDITKKVLTQLKKEKKIVEDQHEGLDGEQVKVIKLRS